MYWFHALTFLLKGHSQSWLHIWLQPHPSSFNLTHWHTTYHNDRRWYCWVSMEVVTWEESKATRKRKDYTNGLMFRFHRHSSNGWTSTWKRKTVLVHGASKRPLMNGWRGKATDPSWNMNHKCNESPHFRPCKACLLCILRTDVLSYRGNSYHQP